MACLGAAPLNVLSISSVPCRFLPAPAMFDHLPPLSIAFPLSKTRVTRDVRTLLASAPSRLGGTVRFPSMPTVKSP
eukprot:6323477-Pyramimonas_sp.AAC.1